MNTVEQIKGASYDNGNNEHIVYGVFADRKNSRYTVITATKSWEYKTESGALKKWSKLEENDLV